MRQLVRVICHGSGAATTAQGKYKPGKGTTLDVFDDTAEYQTLTSNGWLRLAPVGTTAQRPTSVHAPSLYIDTTLGYMIVFDGISWVNPVSGAAV